MQNIGESQWFQRSEGSRQDVSKRVQVARPVYFGGAVWVERKGLSVPHNWEIPLNRGYSICGTPSLLFSRPSPFVRVASGGSDSESLVSTCGVTKSSQQAPLPCPKPCWKITMIGKLSVLPLYNQDNNTYSSGYRGAILSIKCVTYYINLIMVLWKDIACILNLQCNLGHMTGTCRYINQPEKDSPCLFMADSVPGTHSEFCMC